MKIYFSEQYLGNITEYRNYPKLNSQLTDEDIQGIIDQHCYTAEGSATIAMVCTSAVYYFTQCPAKVVMSMVCNKYPNIAPQLVEIGNYQGKFNVFKTQYLNNIEHREDIKYFGDCLEDIVKFNYNTFHKYGNLPNNLEQFREYFELLFDLMEGVKSLGYSPELDCRTPNIYRNVDGTFVLVDPIWVRVTKGDEDEYC